MRHGESKLVTVRLMDYKTTVLGLVLSCGELGPFDATPENFELQRDGVEASRVGGEPFPAQIKTGTVGGIVPEREVALRRHGKVRNVHLELTAGSGELL